MGPFPSLFTAEVITARGTEPQERGLSSTQHEEHGSRVPKDHKRPNVSLSGERNE